MQEVRFICPSCSRTSVGYKSPDEKLKLQHSGFYERTCKYCEPKVKPEMSDEVPDLFSIINAMTRRTKVNFANLKRINDESQPGQP